MPAPDHPLSLPATSAGFRPALPLQGVTILAVEDSRFASEALRLLCQRSGARLRRADTIAAAWHHLGVYRPDVVIVDLGLPDGDGADLIRALWGSGAVVLGTSGDPDGRGAALAAGAADFLDKPTESVAAFQAALCRHLPAAPGPEQPDATTLRPDRLALQDDLARAAALMPAVTDAASRRYVAGFVGSVAASARDPLLASAAGEAATTPAALARLSRLLAARLAAGPAAFAVADRPKPR